MDIGGYGSQPTYLMVYIKDDGKHENKTFEAYNYSRLQDEITRMQSAGYTVLCVTKLNG